MPAELMVPIWAERAEPTAWHPHHIAERYGLMTIIVLGESVLSATLAIQSALDAGESAPALVGLMVGGLLVLFSMWWIYFEVPAHGLLASSGAAFLWGYGHLLIFASTAAVGAGIAVGADLIAGRAHVSARATGAAVAVPVAFYVLCVWALHIRPRRRGGQSTAMFLGTAVLVLATPLLPGTVMFIGFLLSGLVALLIVTGSAKR